MGMTQGVVLRADDPWQETRAKRAHCEVVVQAGWEIPFEATLFLAPGLRLEAELIEAGMRWMGKWDMAAPLMGAGRLAAGVGTPAERDLAQGLMHDLRVPLYSTRLIFVRQSDAARETLERWQQEIDSNPELGFLRALYAVKPRILALPAMWIAREGRVQPQERAMAAVQETTPRAMGLINVEIAPGKYIKCFPSEKEKVLKRYRQQMMRRGQRRAEECR